MHYIVKCYYTKLWKHGITNSKETDCLTLPEIIIILKLTGNLSLQFAMSITFVKFNVFLTIGLRFVKILFESCCDVRCTHAEVSVFISANVPYTPNSEAESRRNKAASNRPCVTVYMPSIKYLKLLNPTTCNGYQIQKKIHVMLISCL